MDKGRKKIGLLTLWKNSNHGTALQAYALSVAISNMGWPAEYILYNSRQFLCLTDKLRILIDKLIYFFKGGFVKSDLNVSNSYLPLMEFWDSIPHSSVVFNKRNCCESIKFYCKYIVGGDQVWNRNITRVNSFYFLDFIDDNVSKYSYSPSFGSAHLSLNYKKILVNQLSSFKYIGCRDISHSIQMQQILHKKVVNTVDPVLLLSKDVWHNFSKEVPSLPNKYLLCYELGNRYSLRKYAELEAQSNKLDLIYMSVSTCNVNLSEISPANFVYMFENADYVVTDSYHGILFSIIFSKTFTPFLKRRGDETSFDNWRIHELCNSLDIQIGSPSSVNKINIDKLNAKIENSKVFLQSILDHYCPIKVG